jgi:hypothetical protein
MVKVRVTLAFYLQGNSSQYALCRRKRMLHLGIEPSFFRVYLILPELSQLPFAISEHASLTVKNGQCLNEENYVIKM